ncbi:39S ribosomal protein L41, mitochondrial [Episyrphus balteatus]|uniref:39S ribosomal protein L41, mitochondrial n=1 Tax=Episyrphus balteatus TaxID=286459 RepID=UPI0024867222|nr:39S ribosomal protein L41, mitochondrial [Episyrphus balteatus]
MEKINKILALAVRPNQRSISTSAILAGKRNFRKFPTFNKRGTRSLKEAQRTSLDPPVPIYKRGVRDTGVYVDGKFQSIPQRIPQLIVPNLENCKLKPYVSYKAPDVVQSEFTSLDLYNAIYAQKVIDDFKAGKLAEDGSPLEPSQQELLTPDEAILKARKTGSDIF